MKKIASPRVSNSIMDNNTQQFIILQLYQDIMYCNILLNGKITIA
jgi:hypothetical protein